MKAPIQQPTRTTPSTSPNHKAPRTTARRGLSRVKQNVQELTETFLYMNDYALSTY